MVMVVVESVPGGTRSERVILSEFCCLLDYLDYFRHSHLHLFFLVLFDAIF